ncbi:MAG: 50S ribosomal protein L34e [Candidatus Aenigmatarchaeota archaeon]
MSSIKEVKVRTTKRLVIHLKKKKPKIAKCAICKKPLHGIKKLLPSEIKKLATTEKRPERIYGGYLCSNCLKEFLKEKARKEWENA